jgi:hypothetical protein
VDLISTGEIEITGGIKITSTYGFEIAMWIRNLEFEVKIKWTWLTGDLYSKISWNDAIGIKSRLPMEYHRLWCRPDLTNPLGISSGAKHVHSGALMANCINHWVDGYTQEMDSVNIGQRTTNTIVATYTSNKMLPLPAVYPYMLSNSHQSQMFIGLRACPVLQSQHKRRFTEMIGSLWFLWLSPTMSPKPNQKHFKNISLHY